MKSSGPTVDFWSYCPKKLRDKKGRPWHFMWHTQCFPDRAPGEQPYTLHFRNDERSVFGVLHFQHSKDNPYRSFATVARKIMDDDEFRATLLNDGSKKVWRGR